MPVVLFSVPGSLWLNSVLDTDKLKNKIFVAVFAAVTFLGGIALICTKLLLDTFNLMINHTPDWNLCLHFALIWVIVAFNFSYLIFRLWKYV